MGRVGRAKRTGLLLTLVCAALLLVAASPAGAVGDRQSAVDAYMSTLQDDQVDRGWTGSTDTCTVGTESQASLDATRHTLNVLRDFAGIGPVSFTAEKNHRALAAALMMLAQGDLSHDPPNTWACYSDEGHFGASTSNLFLGSSGASAMVGYVDDSGIASLGHRRWVLDPGEVEMGSGSTTGSNALVVFNSSADIGPRAPVADDKLVAWPAPGWFPTPWIFKDWSIAIGNDTTESQVDLSGAQVKVTLDGNAVGVSGVGQLEGGFGTGKTLSWQTALPTSVNSGDHKIKVTIDGVKLAGAALPISYSIDAFDPTGNGSNGGGGDACTKAKAKLKKAKKKLAAAKKNGTAKQVEKAKKKVAKAKKRKRKACAK